MKRYQLLVVFKVLWAELLFAGWVYSPVEMKNTTRAGKKPDTTRYIVLDTLPIYDSCHRARPMCLDSNYSFVTPTGFSSAYFFWHECCAGDTLTSCCANYGCLEITAADVA